MNRYLLWVVRLSIMGIILAPLILSPQTVFPFVVGKSLWIRSLVIISVACFSILAYRKPEFRPKLSNTLVIFGFFILVNFLAAVFGLSLTKSFWSTWERMDGVLELIFWFLILVVGVSTFRSIQDWRILFKVNICVGFVVAVLSIGQLLDISFTFFSFLPFTVMYLGDEETYTVGRLTSTVGNPTFLGPYLAIVMIMASGFLFERFSSFYRFIVEKDEKWKKDLLLSVILFSGMCLSLLVILLTGSRGTLLGLASSVVLLIIFLLFIVKSFLVRILCGFTLASILGSLLLIVWMHNIIKTQSVNLRDDIVKEFIGEESYSKYFKTSIDVPPGLEKQNYFNKFMTRDEQTTFLSTLEESVSQKNDLWCDREILFLQEFKIAYFQDRNTMFLQGNLVAQLDDGTIVQIEFDEASRGTFTQCANLYIILTNLHPALAYLVNEGIELKGRSLGWKQAWLGFKERPFLGWGPENFDLVFFKYLKGTDYDGYPPAKLDRAHSRPMDILVTTGVFGITVWLLFWVFLILVIVKNILKRDNELAIHLVIMASMTTYFVSSLFLFPQATWYVQFFLLVGVISRSEIGYKPVVDLTEPVKRKRKGSPSGIDLGNFMVSFVAIFLGAVFIYFLIIIPYSVASNTLPATRLKTISELETIAARFEPLAAYGRLEIINMIMDNLDAISESATEEQLKEIFSSTEQIGLKILEAQPNNFLVNQTLFNFYLNLSRSDEAFLNVAEKYADKLIDLSPEHINAQESKIRLSLIKRDFPEAKKWVDKWKQEHYLLTFKDRIFWDDLLLQLEIEKQR